MSKLTEVTDLLARIAENLHKQVPLGDYEDSCDYHISELNRSLNLNEGPKLRVLDTALSLMCFKAPEVFDTVIEHLVKTIVTVLSSSISCNVLRSGKQEVLQIGSTISCHDCVGLIEASVSVLGKIEGHGEYSCSLLYAILRVAASASCFQYILPSMPVLDQKSNNGKSPAVSKLLCYFPEETSLKAHEMPVRLLFWYLDPLILKDDISKILQDSMQRPFLCLYEEFVKRKDWHSILLCLVLSPIMFIEVTALLNNWFLMTGIASILELQIVLTSLILDVISRPTWWGISVEIGSKLPSSRAYFPYKHHLFKILSGPLSCKSLLYLSNIGMEQRLSDSSSKQVSMVYHKSYWAMAINFPEWFLFACIMLFSARRFPDNFHIKCTLLGASETGQSNDAESPCSSANAARYIAWIMNPMNKAHQDMLVDLLIKISGSWALKQFGSDTLNKQTRFGKKLKKPKFGSKEDFTLPKGYNNQGIGLWLKEFDEIFSCLGDKRSALLRKIPLGLLIGFSDLANEEGCEQLLHYAATSTIRDKNSSTWKAELKVAINGASLVFNLTDAVENMSATMFDSEELGVDFISRVKERSRKYLIKCVRNIIQTVEDDRCLMLRDLSCRLLRWRHQGREVFQGDKDLDNILNSLDCKSYLKGIF